MISLRLWRSFVAVIDAGTVIGAARSRSYSAAAISRQMAALQSRLGVVLFEPEGRSVRPTDAALALVEPARGALREADALELLARDVSERTRATGRRVAA